MNNELLEKAENIKMLITDVDGVLTDGRIILGNNGEEFKFFHVHDGKGIKLAQAAGIQVALITGRSSRLVARRAEELAIREVYQGIHDKLAVFRELIDEYGIKPEQAAYIGDDVNDICLLKEVGLSFSVKNGVDEVKKVVDYVTEREGGKGAVREVVELLLKGKRTQY